MDSEFGRGWKVLIACVVGAGCGLSSVSFYTHGVFVVPITTDTGWSRSDVQFGVSIMILMAIFTAPLIGLLIDKVGARRVALISIPLYGLTLASLSLAGDAIWTYYLAWACMSILAAGTLPIAWTRVAIGWFDRRRGIALGLTLAGTGIAATFGPSYATHLIENFGWRKAYVLLALTISCIAIPVVGSLLREPQPREQRNGVEGAAKIAGLTLSQAIRRYRFWAMSIGLVLAASGISGLITNSVSMLIDSGLQATSAAGYAGLIGVSVISGRLIAGYLLDRFWAPAIAAIFLAAPALSALFFANLGAGDWQISAAMIVLGLAAGAELDLMAFLVSRYFGLRHYGALYGALYVAFSIGAGLAPFGFAKAFDYFGDYSTILNIIVGTSLLGGALMLSLGAYPSASNRR